MNNRPSVQGTSGLFFLTRPAHTAPSLASLEQTYLLWPPRRASPHSRSPGASVPPTGARGGDPCPGGLPHRVPCPAGPSPVMPQAGWLQSPPPHPPTPTSPQWLLAIPPGACDHPQAASQLLSHRHVGGGASGTATPEPALTSLGSGPSSVRWGVSPAWLRPAWGAPSCPPWSLLPVLLWAACPPILQ